MPCLIWFEARQDVYAAWRRDIHAHPELGFDEHRTSDIVATKLQQWGIEVHRGVGKTGLVGVLRGSQPGAGTVGLRADMDALPMQEQTDLPYRSNHDGRFHGCGHDGHTTTLLAAAEYLAQHNDFAGTVHFIFQPAEETLGGALAMIEDGLFQRFPCDEIYALHNNPMLEAGHVGVRAGAILSAGDLLRIRVHGVGSHGAAPHKGKDPITIACQLVGMLQTMPTRSIDPLESVVISMGMIHGGTAPNVIPDRVELEGTVRSLSISAREQLLQRIQELCYGLAAAHAVRIDVEIVPGCPPTINAEQPAALVARVAAEVVGRANVDDQTIPLMGSEDFSYMLQERPGAYFFVGQDGPFCHHPEFDFDDNIVAIGASVFAGIVSQRLR